MGRIVGRGHDSASSQPMPLSRRVGMRELLSPNGPGAMRRHNLGGLAIYLLSKRKEMANPIWGCGSRKVRVP